MTPDEFLSIVTFIDIKTDQGTMLEQWAEGTIVETLGDGEAFLVEFAIPDDHLVGGHRFELAQLTSDQFAITEAAGNSE